MPDAPTALNRVAGLCLVWFSFCFLFSSVLSGCQGAKTELLACHLVQRMLLLFPFFPGVMLARGGQPFLTLTFFFLFFPQTPELRKSVAKLLPLASARANASRRSHFDTPAEGGTRRDLSAAAACYIDECRRIESAMPPSTPSEPDGFAAAVVATGVFQWFLHVQEDKWCCFVFGVAVCEWN